MYLYNVTYSIDEDAAAEWLQWMREFYIPRVMATGAFTQYKLFRLLGTDDKEGITLAVQYAASNLESVNVYLEDHAPAMAEVMKQRFGSKHVAFRTLLEQIG